MNSGATELLATLVLMFIVYYTIKWCFGAVEDHIYSKKLAKAIRILEQSSVRFRFNTVNNVIAVCTLSSYRDLASFKFEQGKPWVPTIRCVTDIFTFALKEERKLDVHTGTMSDLENLLNEIILELTGLSKKNLKPEDFRELCQILMIRDHMLYVPYAGGEKQMEEDFKLFPVQPLAVAKDTIVR